MNADFLKINARDRDQFLRELVSELALTLQNVVGMVEAEGFVKIVGLKIGEAIHADYAEGRDGSQWTTEDLAEALVDLKRKIDGGFSVESIGSDRIILKNDRCPFGDLVKGKPSLCQMTSSVFGKISSEAFDYSRIVIEKAIANGDSHCRVVVHLSPPDHNDAKGVEFYKSR